MHRHDRGQLYRRRRNRHTSVNIGRVPGCRGGVDTIIIIIVVINFIIYRADI